ncbi:DUF5753 domain-containing protein [Actinomadura parmotrematis]|uniref:DUF5753 domain-containing protein n=1 Tax=Actinomadura parmotrematis TaxID=2864039 RepID=A0ABS7FQZ4_9ACTN|nr:DUF5753 domain-containing protein [Actinomadura parmotrematis]MBW8481958.1 DUF5753 domain-containing protein [Actinomadura parmotrematis]
MRTRGGFDPDGDLWDCVASELRHRRIERSLSLAAVGDLIDRDRSLVARVEAGETKLQAKHAVIIDRAWTTGGLFTRLVGFAKSKHDVEWFKTHLEKEARAGELRIWELGWIPGLFQTEGYMRAIFEAFAMEDIEEGVKVRLRRQQCLHRRPRPRIWVLLDQSIIEQPVGSSRIMHEQIEHLMEMARLPHITIRIVPREAGAHAGRDGSFKIMSEGVGTLVYVAAHGGGRLVHDAAELASYRVWFDMIGDVALTKDASLHLLEEALERFS